MTFWNDGTFTWTSSVQGLPVILKWHNLQSLDKALDLLIEFKFCKSDSYFLNGSKNCMVATYNFGSVYSQGQYDIISKWWRPDVYGKPQMTSHLSTLTTKADRQTD